MNEGMAWHKATFFESWSVSRYNDWAPDEGGCPKFAHYKHIIKIKEPEENSPAMARGSRIHQEAEDYLKNKTNIITPDMKIFEKEFKFLKKYGADAEADWTFRRDWTMTKWDDWDNAWVRVKLDAKLLYDDNSLQVIDFKTGKINEYPLQMKLYGVAGFLAHPEVDRIDTELWFLDHPKQKDKNPKIVSYDRSEFEGLRKEWEMRIMPMLRDRAFPPKPSRKCNWCFYRKENEANVADQYKQKGVKVCQY